MEEKKWQNELITLQAGLHSIAEALSTKRPPKAEDVTNTFKAIDALRLQSESWGWDEAAAIINELGRTIAGGLRKVPEQGEGLKDELERLHSELVQLPLPDPSGGLFDQDEGFVLKIDLLKVFADEVQEVMETITAGLLDLECNPGNRDAMNEVFRSFHNMKGSSAAVGLTEVNKLTHYLESMLDLIREGQMAIDSNFVDLAFAGLDMIRELLSTNAESIGQDFEELAGIMDAVVSGGRVLVLPENLRVKRVVQNTGSKVPEILNEADAAGDALLRQERQGESTIRVETIRLDQLMNLIGELLISRTVFSQIEKDYRDYHGNTVLCGQLQDSLQQFTRITSFIQEHLTQIRMVPVARVFNRFPRLVRDLARDLNKEIRLQITGEDTEVDKTVVEFIADPLTHLVRNAVGHGIERSGERAESGKQAVGTVSLNACHEGNNIVIEISDDGSGMDAESIYLKALDKGLINVGETLSDDEKINLIFLPGLSTAATVSELSGRGVGLDVVRKNIHRLNGGIEVKSELGQGTVFRLKVPLTLAILQALMVEVGQEVFALPLTNVIESIEILPGEVRTVGQREVINVRGQVIPLLALGDLFELPMGEQFQKYPVVLVSDGKECLGLLVDRLRGQEEIVIKPLSDVGGGCQGIAGATILGDGRVRLIIDVPAVMRESRSILSHWRKNINAGGSVKLVANKKVLVADDSEIYREFIENVVSVAGFQVVVASSGEEALQQAAKNKVDLALLDSDMPGTSGLKLASALRKNSEYINLPVIILGQHTQEEESLTLALPKPFNTDDLISRMYTLTG